MNRPGSLEPTRYELTLSKGNEKFLICYCMRTGRHSLLKAIHAKGEAILKIANLSDDAMLTWSKPAKLGAMLGGWRVYFTGRTQRSAITEGELPFVLDIAKG